MLRRRAEASCGQLSFAVAVPFLSVGFLGRLLSAADALLEAGEEPTDLFLRRSPCRTAGPASILIRTERWRLSGEGLCPAPRVTSGEGDSVPVGRKRSGSPLFRDVSHNALPINRCT